MACVESVCTSHKCNWSEFTNMPGLVCPKCGSALINHFDEAGTDDDTEETNDDDDSED